MMIVKMHLGLFLFNFLSGVVVVVHAGSGGGKFLLVKIGGSSSSSSESQEDGSNESSNSGGSSFDDSNEEPITGGDKQDQNQLPTNFAAPLIYRTIPASSIMSPMNSPIPMGPQLTYRLAYPFPFPAMVTQNETKSPEELFKGNKGTRPSEPADSGLKSEDIPNLTDLPKGKILKRKIEHVSIDLGSENPPNKSVAFDTVVNSNNQSEKLNSKGSSGFKQKGPNNYPRNIPKRPPPRPTRRNPVRLDNKPPPPRPLAATQDEPEADKFNNAGRSWYPPTQSFRERAPMRNYYRASPIDPNFSYGLQTW